MLTFWPRRDNLDEDASDLSSAVKIVIDDANKIGGDGFTSLMQPLMEAVLTDGAAFAEDNRQASDARGDAALATAAQPAAAGGNVRRA